MVPRWPAVLRAGWTRSCRRALSTRSHESHESHERVDVRCGSSGYVTVDLFNAREALPESALVIHLPPAPTPDGFAPALPAFLRGVPVASINYQWRDASQAGGSGGTSTPLCWPTPVHDTAAAFAWLMANLAPSGSARRDMYVYGSYLGGGLAAALALTETRAHAKFGIRGVVAYNGVYNWTMFLPHHRINNPSPKSTKRIFPHQLAEGSHLYRLRDEMPRLFDTPSSLFDPFASPCLFFHSPGLATPRSFSTSMDDAAAMDALMAGDDDDDDEGPPKMLRRMYLVFPPRGSELTIPETLLLHDSPPPLPTKKKGRPRLRAADLGHTFEAQANNLAEAMQRSIDIVETEARRAFGEDAHDIQTEGLRRVQVVDVGTETAGLELRDAAQQIALAWLQDRTAPEMWK